MSQFKVMRFDEWDGFVRWTAPDDSRWWLTGSAAETAVREANQSGVYDIMECFLDGSPENPDRRIEIP